MPGQFILSLSLPLELPGGKASYLHIKGREQIYNPYIEAVLFITKYVLKFSNFNYFTIG
jgi:hypothetical protein